jgi:hypothetical protein
MTYRNARMPALGMAIAIVMLTAGCGGGGSGHQAGSAATSSAPTTTKVAGTTPMTKAGQAPAAGSSAELSVLRQQLDDVGSSLGGADGALGQADPNQSKTSEGTAP